MDVKQDISITSLQRKIKEVLSALKEHYGPPRPHPAGDPLDHLVATILSQNTSDVNSGRAYRELKRRYPLWEQVLDATTAEIADAIRVGGLADQKAPRISRILRALNEERGLDLSFLSGLSDQEAREWLQRLPGVGPKTAACVLLFALGRDVFPVDTHVERVAKRLGLASAKTPPAIVESRLKEISPPGTCLSGHLLFIRHGRETCRARFPACAVCPVSVQCLYFQTSVSGGALTEEPARR